MKFFTVINKNSPIALMVIWVLFLGVPTLAEFGLQSTYITDPLFFCVFFISVIVLMYSVYKEQLDHQFFAGLRYNKKSVVVLLVVLVVMNISYMVLGTRLPVERIAAIGDVEGVGIYTFNVNYSIAKTLEILLQQLLLLVMISSVHIKKVLITQKRNEWRTQYAYHDRFTFSLKRFGKFLGMFAFVHLPLIFFIPQEFAVVFITGSAIGGMIFYILITKLTYGFVHSVALHWLFYIGLAVIGVLT